MSINKNVPPYVAHFDGNQVPSMMGVVGTLGTSDTGGTSLPMPIGVNETTGAMYVQDLSSHLSLDNLMVAIANPSYVDKSANVIRNQVQSGTITIVSVVTALSNMGVWPGGQLSFTASQNTWANMCRSLIT